MKLDKKIVKYGFTLAEMLVVMSILSILTAAALPVISKREYTSHSLETGSIVAWDKSAIPDGYHICDGSAPGIPDLRDYFIRATGTEPTDPAAGSVGGSASIDFTKYNGATVDPAEYLPLHGHSINTVYNAADTHTHSITLNNETHIHSVTFGSSGHAHVHPIYYYSGGGSCTTTYVAGNSAAVATYGSSWGSYGATANHYHSGTSGASSYASSLTTHVHSVAVAASGTHNHTLNNLNAQGSNTWATPRPQYYALYYIIKQ